MKKVVVVNLFGAPGSGKSTTAAAVFAHLKTHHYTLKTEYVTEYAKERTYAHDTSVLNPHSMMTMASQAQRVIDIAQDGQVDCIITDSPIILAAAYSKYKNCVALGKEISDQFENINIFIPRLKPYSQYGRTQTADEALLIGDKVHAMLTDHDVDFIDFTGFLVGVEGDMRLAVVKAKILEIIMRRFPN